MSTHTQTGTAELQGRLWSVNATDWAEFQEPYMAPAYSAALDALEVGRAPGCSTPDAVPEERFGWLPIAART